ncbi:MAG: hypothetical protein GY950_24375, partial [bacterium]|nr:hypothetical protein [bacterium]
MKRFEKGKNGLELIKQLEKEIGENLKEVDFEQVGGNDNGFSLNEAQEVIGLNLDNMELEALPASLSKFDHLEKLNLFDNEISDISILGELKNLTSLSLSLTGISDISILAELKNLTRLSLSLTGISDISILA